MSRTQDQILARIRDFEAAGDDMFGFSREVLIGALDYEHAKPYLKDGVTVEEWTPELMDRGSVLAQLTGYLAFAFGKAEDHRGISASRSVQKLTEYAWLLGNDQALAAIEGADYMQYGVPKLAALARALDLPVPAGEDIQRMANGQPCVPDCVEGCPR